MKKFIFGLPIIILLIAFAASAFTGNPDHSVTPIEKPDLIQWEYLGPQGEENDPQHYSQLTGTPTYSCGGSGTVCTIMAESDNGSTPQPVLDNKNPLIDQEDFDTEIRSVQ